MQHSCALLGHLHDQLQAAGAGASRRCLLLALAALLVAGLLSPRLIADVASQEVSVQQFLEKHWQRPLQPQGEPPAEYTPLEASLLPKDCGACHPVQYQDWQTSLHGKSTGPGVAGQIIDMLPNDPEQATLCLSCHAPLAEQNAHRRSPASAAAATFVPNPSFNAELQQHGMLCAACHARQRRVYGSPRRPGVVPPPPGGRPVHGGVERTPAFRDSSFCKSCHQFDADGYALNGKLLENTYNEWAAGPSAKEGTHCQDCHMPDRRHLWRGIHDPETVRQAITVTVTLSQPTYQPGETVRATIAVRNSGAGHYFPTYVTPMVFVRAKLLGPENEPLEGTEQVAAIGREVTLDLSREVYDTRIPPQQEMRFTYAAKLPAAPPTPGSPAASARHRATLQVRVVVEPDHFYERFFISILAQNGALKGRAMLQQALEAARSSRFTVFSQDIPVS